MNVRTLAMALAVGTVVSAVAAMTGCAGNRARHRGAYGCSDGSCVVPAYAGGESYSATPYGNGGPGVGSSFGSGTR